MEPLLGGDGEHSAARNVNFPRKQFHLLVVHHEVGVHESDTLGAGEVHGGAGVVVEILALAEHLIEQRLAEGYHDFGLNKVQFLGKHLAERGFQKRRERAFGRLEKVRDADVVLIDA